MRKCRLQKTISFLLSFILVLGLCIVTVPDDVKAAGGVQFTVQADKTELQRGDTVNVTVSMSGNTQGYGLVYELVFDPEKLEAGEPQPGEVFDDLVASKMEFGLCNVADGNKVVATIVKPGTSDHGIVDGRIMTVPFKVLENAAAGSVGFGYAVELVTADAEPQDVPAQNNTAGMNLNVVTPVTGITLSRTEMNLTVGQAETLTATLTPEGVSSAITWKSSNEAVVTVAQDGTVTAVSGGSAVVTATAGSVSAECKVNVEAPKVPMTGISVSDMEVSRGQAKKLEVSYSPADTTDDKGVTYESSNTDVATVDNMGVVTGKKEGTATITVKTTGTATPFTATAKVKVNEKSMTKELVGKIAFDKAEMEVLKGQTVYMEDFLNVRKVLEENGITDSYTVTWSSSEKKVAAVDAEGKALGVKEGEADITAEVLFTNGAGEETGKFAVTTKVIVKEIPLDSIAFDKVIKEMAVGTTETLSIIYNPNNTTDLRDVVWASSDTTVLTVENGRVTALKVGEADVSATVGSKTISCRITVKEGARPVQDKKEVKGDAARANNSPKTGDTADVVLYVVMLLSALAAVLFVYRRRAGNVRR